MELNPWESSIGYIGESDIEPSPFGDNNDYGSFNPGYGEIIAIPAFGTLYQYSGKFGNDQKSGYAMFMIAHSDKWFGKKEEPSVFVASTPDGVMALTGPEKAKGGVEEDNVPFADAEKRLGDFYNGGNWFKTKFTLDSLKATTVPLTSEIKGIFGTMGGQITGMLGGAQIVLIGGLLVAIIAGVAYAAYQFTPAAQAKAVAGSAAQASEGVVQGAVSAIKNPWKHKKKKVR
jgi:hypothetical protein